MKNPLFEALFAALQGQERSFLILSDGRQISGGAVSAQVARFAHALAEQGLVAGDRLAVQVTKSPESLALYGAALALGAVFLPLNTAYTAAELDYFIGNATPRLLICDPARAVELMPLAARHRAGVLTLDGQGCGTLADAAAGLGETIVPADCDGGDLAAILYTSGTTGRSKGAMLSHDNLLSNARSLAECWRFTTQDVLLHALPVFHTHGLFVACNVSLLTGGRMIYLPGFERDQVLDLLPQATVMMGVPTFYTRLLGSPRLNADLVSGLRLFISGSAPLLAKTHRAFAARTGHRIVERYGMTETSMNTSNPDLGDRRAGTVGLPLPGVEVRIDAAAGEVGGILVRGPNVFQGYWQMPDKTAEELRPDGWFITGDLGSFDADGYLRIVGRAKDLIITGGYNVYPKEVELALDAVPGVVESAVIGLPHPDLGEAVFAVLVGALTPEAALAAIAPGLARFKQPRAAVVVPDLPRNAMGKVQKNVLRQEFADWFAKG